MVQLSWGLQRLPVRIHTAADTLSQLDQLGHKANMVEQLASYPEISKAFFCLLAPLKTGTLMSHSKTDFSNVVYIASLIQRVVCCFLSRRECRMQQFIFHFEQDTSISQTKSLEASTMCRLAEILWEFLRHLFPTSYFPSRTNMMSSIYQPSMMWDERTKVPLNQIIKESYLRSLQFHAYFRGKKPLRFW